MNDLLSKFALKVQKSGTCSNIMNLLLQLIVEGKISAIERDKVLKANAIDSVDSISTESINVIIAYAKECLLDGILTEEEMSNIRILKMFFKIKEGDFYKNGKQDAVKSIVKEQLEKLYADNEVDSQEALMKVDLQMLFDLSYDEFLEIVNEVAKESLKRGANLLDLDTFLK